MVGTGMHQGALWVGKKWREDVVVLLLLLLNVLQEQTWARAVRHCLPELHGWQGTWQPPRQKRQRGCRD